jgi:hypothetical protein
VWLIFSVLFPFAPIAMGTRLSILWGTPTSFIDIAEILRSGELVYAAAGISAAALGEALLSNVGHFRGLVILLIFVDLCSVSIALILGATLSHAYELLGERVHETLGFWTAWLYLAAVLQGGVSVALNSRIQPQ